MTSKDTDMAHSSIEDMVEDFDQAYYAEMDDMERTPKGRRIGKTLRKTLLSAVAVIAVIGFGSHYVEGAGVDAQHQSLIQLKPGEVSSDPLSIEDKKMAFLEDEMIGRGLAAMEPATGEAPQMLGGSSDDLDLPMPVAVEQVPPPLPSPDAVVLASPGEVNPAPFIPDETGNNQIGAYQAGSEPPIAGNNNFPSPDIAVSGALVPATPATMPEMQNEVVGGNSVTTRLTPEPGSNKPDVYYDSSLNVPTGPLAETVGPRKVDPVLEPASKMIVSKQTARAGDMEAQIVAANRALELGRYESALEMFDQLYARNQRDTRILMGRAVAQQRMGMDDVAILSYEALLDLLPNNTNAIVNMMGLLKKQYPSVALRRLTDLREKYPANAGIAAQLGMTYAELGQNQEALRALGTAASLEPQNPQHLYNMAVIADRAGSKALAIQYYEESLQEDAVYGGGRSVPREKIYDRLSTLRQ